jgi:hypothetical protein
MLRVLQRRDLLSIHNFRERALTLVLRSTHSSQLSVGLFRFCFFLDVGPVPTLPSGLREDCASSIMVPSARIRISYLAMQQPAHAR